MRAAADRRGHVGNLGEEGGALGGEAVQVELPQEIEAGRIFGLGQEDLAERLDRGGWRPGAATRGGKPNRGERRITRVRAVRVGSRKARVSQT